ncbi:MAG: ThiF family adenylyltransferase [Alicyclobacillaceae bacterium]|nr:ThiF family adenylyltransferase [Alicyclobacillaceae bacterium]
MDRTTPIGRYSRQILFAPIGASGQKRLSASRVAVVGLGALGTVLANHMVRAGVGFVRLIDRDFVEESNLQRQMLYDERDAEEGLPKAAAAARHLADFNRDVRLEPVIADLTWRNAESLLGDVDIILDGTDNFEVRYLVNDVAVKRGIPWIYGGAVAAHGVVLPVLPGDGPCLRCLFPEAPAPGEAPTCDTAGVIGPVVHVVASLQGTEALKMLVGDRKAIRRRLVYLDLWENRWSETDVSRSRRPDCPCCGARRFDWLSPRTDDAVSLCGRQAIQVTLGAPLDLERLERRLAPLGQVRRNPFLLRFQIEDKRLTVFPDGRVLVQGTDDPAAARSLCARYIGG